MSSHADTIRMLLARQRSNEELNAGFAALDALLAENQRLEEEIRIREESQIPVIPTGAQRKMDALEAENQRLHDALEGLGAERCEMAFVLEEIGRPEKDCRAAYTREQWCASCIAREVLAGDAGYMVDGTRHSTIAGAQEDLGIDDC